MKLLLTSNGITNNILASELERLANKKFNELKIGFIPTAAFVDPKQKDWLILDQYRLLERGAKVFIISLADLTKQEIEEQLSMVDVIFVGGGNTFYLSYILQEKGLFDLIPKLLESKVYAGISAGSMVVSATLRVTSQYIENQYINDEQLEKLGPKNRSSAKTLNLVPFAVRPHLNHHLVNEINNGVLEEISSKMKMTIYAIDDSCAVSVNGEEIKIVGEGESKIIG
jgi:dipeptidase E